jgi:hypothetical protein
MVMKETSWRTLMLLTTLFVVVVIFQATVRSPKPSAASVQLLNALDLPQDPNETPAPAAIHPPVVVTVVAEPLGSWLDDAPEESDEPTDPNDPEEAPPAVPE